MHRLKEMGVKRNLRRRITEIYRETGNMVKIEEERTEEFWTTIGVRQRCPLSPTLFNAFLSDIEEDMSKVQKGGVVIGTEKVRTIVYADDTVLVATTEVGMKETLRRYKKYVERKGLTVNTEKFKVLNYESGRGRGRRRREWRWGEEKLEEVKEMKYLGYIVEKNGKAEKHIQERIRKAAVAMKRTWHIGERLFKEDIERI